MVVALPGRRRRPRLRPRRDPRAARRTAPGRGGGLLAALELDDDAAYRLCHGHRREGGLVARQTLTHGAAIAFADDVLPGLEKSGQVELEEVGGRPDYRAATGAPVIRFAAAEDGSTTAPPTTRARTGSTWRS